MIVPTGGLKIYIASHPVDFRKGHDGLSALVMSQLGHDPVGGSVFVFRSKRSDRLKLIFWDGNGLVMAYKRLEDRSFAWPEIKNGVMRLDHTQFEALFAGLDWRKVQPLKTRHPGIMA